VLKFLVNWLVYHILDNDRRMAKVVRALEDGLDLAAAKARADAEMTGLMHTFVETVLNMYENLTSRSLELIREKNERQKTEQALLASELQKQAMDKLLQSMKKTIEAMAATVEIRAPYTAGHQRRVAQLAEAIARELGLPQDEVHGIYLAASVHDIGDIQIPAEILTRPGRLNPIEQQIVQSHARAGYDILKGIDFPWPIAEMVHQHHERMDGSGYPQGLRGEQILPGARVMAVADVVEAMSSHRPYRASLGLEAALAEIDAHRGQAYDPAAVVACLRLFREKKFVFQD
jgi:putative nucleotidyltransferase with HDIG domain